MATRASLAAALRADGNLAAWEVYTEPPEQLAGGSCIVIAPRSPYQTWATYGAYDAHLTLSLLVPRSHGPAMDAIDTGLDSVISVLRATSGVGIGTLADAALVDDIGGAQYVVAAIEVDLTDIAR